MSLNRRSLPEVIRAALEAHTEGMHIALPGKVVSYDASKQTASVDCAVKLPLRGEFGEVVYESLPTFPDVPIAWHGGGGFFFSMPLVPGDPVLLVFSDIATGEYLNTGETSSPADTRRHSLGYPTAFPGAARPDTKALADASSTDLLAGKDGGTGQIRIKASSVELGKGATDYVALASLVDARITALQDKLDAVCTGLGVPILGVQSPTAATLVKAK